MPSRQSTARVYGSFLKNHILPQWGDTPIRDVQPRPVEWWLRELPLAPKSKTHVWSLMHGCGVCDVGRSSGDEPQSNLISQEQRRNTKGPQGTEPDNGAVSCCVERAA